MVATFDIERVYHLTLYYDFFFLPHAQARSNPEPSEKYEK